MRARQGAAAREFPGEPTPGGQASRIVAAASRCYDRSSMDTTSMDDVAAEAGLSRPTLYRHFGTKEDLVVAVIQERARRMRDRAEAVVDTSPTLDGKIVDGLLTLVESVLADPVLCLLLVPDRLQELGRLEDGTRLSVALNATLFEPVLTAARERGEVHPDLDIPALCRWLVYVELIMAGRLTRSPDQGQAHRETLLRLVVPALHRAPPAAGTT